MTKREFFLCETIKWDQVEDLFSQMASRTPPREYQPGLLPPDLAVIKVHLDTCSKCRKVFVDLAKKHGITEGTIFSREEDKSGDSKKQK